MCVVVACVSCFALCRVRCLWSVASLFRAVDLIVRVLFVVVVACCLLLVGRWLELCVVCCVLFAVCCLLCAVCGVLFVVCWLVFNDG